MLLTVPIIFPALIAAIYAIYSILPLHIKYYDEINTGIKIISELDNYYNVNKKYPDENDLTIIENIYRKAFLKDTVEFNEAVQPYYYNNIYGDKIDGYILIYVFGFDEELYYYSPVKEWQFGHSSRILCK
jgi:hypothetical protein